MLSVALFGSMSVSLQSPSGLRTLTLPPRPAELLALLALGRGRFFLRTDIAESLWGHHEEDATVGSVNTALWRLRQAIEQMPTERGDFLVTNRQGAVGLNGRRPVLVDVAEFEGLTRNGLSKPIEQLTEADCKALRDGIELYRESALADFDDPWALRQRERLRNTYQNAAGRLMQLSELRREYERAIHYARLVLAVDPLREDVQRDLMRYLVHNGQRALALRQFELCRAVLRREFAISPMNETIALCRQIAEGAVLLPKRQTGPSQPEPTARAVSDKHLARQRAERFAIGESKASAGPAEHILLARTLIAEADDHLQQSLNLDRR